MEKDQEVIEVKRKRLPFTMVENAIIQDERLSKSDVMIYLILCMHADKNGENCYPSIRTIARESRSDKKTVIKSIDELVKIGYLLKEYRSDPGNPKVFTSNLYTIIGGVVEKNTQGGGKEHPGGGGKEVIKQDPSFESDPFKNVKLEIISFFDSFKIVTKDRKVWLSKYKDDLQYLVKQLRYTEKQENILNYSGYIQAALDRDFAYSDPKEIDKRECEWQEQKERENIDSKVFSDKYGFNTTKEIDELSQEKLIVFNKLLAQYNDDKELVPALQAMIVFIQSGANIESQTRKYISEIEPLLKARKQNIISS